MTEAEWLASDKPEPMIEALGWIRSERKWRLFAVACCRSIERMIPLAGEYAQERYRTAIQVAERFADSQAGEDELLAACDAARDLGYGQDARDPFQWVASPDGTEVHVVWALALDVAGQEFYPETNGDDNIRNVESERLAQASLLRESFGNPFRPVVFSAEWRTSTVVALAKQIYESRDFSAMPILADALQDAGCDNDDVLNHCRNEKQPHVRGCWVVDLVLDKS